MLKIGVSSCFFYPDLDRNVFGAKTICYLERDMARYLHREGVMPILIPDLERAEMQKFVEEMDGIVLQGGSDLAPETYGEEPIGRWKGDPYRDEYELAVVKHAMKHDKPVFGICRGMQLLNVYFGGTLYQDLGTQRPEMAAHRNAVKYDQLNHEIEWTPGKLLAELHADDPHKRVNTVHHQAVKDLGKELEVWATSPDDGLIEAFGWTGAEPGRVSGVQWHPEFFWNSETPLSDPDRILLHFYDLIRSTKNES